MTEGSPMIYVSALGNIFYTLGNILYVLHLPNIIAYTWRDPNQVIFHVLEAKLTTSKNQINQQKQRLIIKLSARTRGWMSWKPLGST